MSFFGLWRTPGVETPTIDDDYVSVSGPELVPEADALLSTEQPTPSPSPSPTPPTITKRIPYPANAIHLHEGEELARLALQLGGTFADAYHVLITKMTTADGWVFEAGSGRNKKNIQLYQLLDRSTLEKRAMGYWYRDVMGRPLRPVQDRESVELTFTKERAIAAATKAANATIPYGDDVTPAMAQQLEKVTAQLIEVMEERRLEALATHVKTKDDVGNDLPVPILDDCAPFDAVKEMFSNMLNFGNVMEDALPRCA